MGWGPSITIGSENFDAARIGADVGTGGTAELGRAYDQNVLRPQREQARSDEQMLADRRAQMEALGQSELGISKDYLAKGDAYKLTDAETAALDKSENQSRMAVNRYFGAAGLSDSSMKALTQADVGVNRAIAESNLIKQDQAFYYNLAQQHYQNAFKAYGVSDQAMSALIQSHQAEAQQTQQMVSDLLQVVGTVGGAAVGGPGGAAAGGTAGRVSGKLLDPVQNVDPYAYQNMQQTG